MNQTRQGGALRKRLGNATASGLFALLTLHSVTSTAAISDVPLFVTAGANPNIVFTIDDSGSMGRDYMPNDIAGNDDFENINGNYTDGIRADHPFYYSSEVNTVYFDPDATYEPPLKPDGSGRFPNSDYNDAWANGYDNDDTSYDLSNNYRRPGWIIEGGGFYWEYDGTVDEGDPDGCDVDKRQPKCFTYHSVNNASDEMKQKFANWYAYYRTRRFEARAGISQAFEELNENVRLGWGAINHHDTLVQGVRPFDSSGQEAFRTWLYDVDASGGTPLRRALKDMGEYFERTDDSGPWSDDPLSGTSDGEHSACRQSFSILMTDGVWNQNSPSVGNTDGNDGSTISSPEGDTFQYEPAEPFTDNRSNTLADVAMEYWKRDLRPDLPNQVPHDDELKVEFADPNNPEDEDVIQINPAFWQHMVTYGVGLGVSGSVDPDTAIEAIVDNSTVNWGDVNTADGKIDDLLHAAVNGRGGFFSASDPEEFATELGGVLQEIQARVESSATAAAASSAVLNIESDRFVAGFRSGDWSGTLVSENIENGGENWNAEEQLRNATSRDLFTSSGGTGVALSLTNLSSDQTDALNTSLAGNTDGLGSDRLEWLAGDDDANSTFRERNGPNGKRLLGDIVNSNPQIERKTNFGHARLPDGGYNSYRNSDVYKDRPDVLYVGANDGFLHAFNANSGEEIFAYMPSSLLEPEGGNSYAAINELMDEEYEHRYFVDGTPTIMDAYIDNQWRTILVGSMGVGGDQVFALDITEPTTFDEDDVLWEFSHSDLERGVDAPQVGRLPTGEWAAIFGNGVGASTGKLFVVNLETGSVIETLDAGSGGLATPVFTVNDGIVEYAYAGNMDGELFRFDLSESNTNQWDATKLFQTEGPGGNAQPITSRPRVANMPQNFDKRVVTFGTGSFFQQGDRGDNSVQSLYGIIDEGGASSGIERDDLVEQTIEGDTTETIDVVQDDGTTVETDFTVRRTSDNPLGDSDEGWVLDLDEVSGERVVSNPTFPSGLDRSRVRFTTLIPNSDPCKSGTTGFLMEVGLVAGGNPSEPVFDLSNDTEFDEEDYCNDCGGGGSNQGPPAGTKLLGGEQLSTIRDEDRDCIVTKGDMCLKAGDIGVGRQSWKQLR